MKTIAACAVGIALMLLAIGQRPDSADDFRSFYRAARLAAAHESVYSQPFEFPDKNTDEKFLPYVRIPSYAAALRPLAALPYLWARRLWLGTGVLAFIGCLWLFPQRRAWLALALSFSFPLAYAFVLGQDIGMVLLIALLAAAMAASGREFLAGVAASLLGIKISYLPAVGLVFLEKSRQGTYGLVTGLAIQLAVSFAAAGTGWPSTYIALLRSPFFDTEPRRMLNVRAVAASLALPGGTYIIGGAALFLCFWWALKRLSLPDGLTLALPLGLIAAPHCYVYDAVVLIPLLVSVADADCWDGLLALTGLTPLPYMLLLTQHASFLLAGSATVVITTIVAGVRFYKMRSMPDGAPTRSFSALLQSPSSG